MNERKRDIAHALVEEEPALTSRHRQNCLNGILVRTGEAAVARIPFPSTSRFTIRVAFVSGVLSLRHGRYGVSENVLPQELQR